MVQCQHLGFSNGFRINQDPSKIVNLNIIVSIDKKIAKPRTDHIPIQHSGSTRTSQKALIKSLGHRTSISPTCVDAFESADCVSPWM